MKTPNDFVEAAGLLKALGHPVRLKIVCGLLGEPANLSRIARDLGLPVSTMARHLAVLRGSRVLVEQKHGVQVVFQVADGRVPRILRVLCHSNGEERRLPRWGWRSLQGQG